MNSRVKIRPLRAGGHDAPPATHTRQHGVRDQPPGRAVVEGDRFRAGRAGKGDRAGLEAALEAAGILDAWVTPDGNLVDGDVTVVSGSPRCPVSRARWRFLRPRRLTPPIRRHGCCPTRRSKSVLPQSAWAAPAGLLAVTTRRQVGERRPRRCLGEGQRRLHRREGRVRPRGAPGSHSFPGSSSRSGRRSASSMRRWTTWACAGRLSDEHRAVPPDAAVREAHTVAAGERGRRGELREQHAHAVTVREQRLGELTSAVAQAEEFARDVGLPAEPGELADVKAGVAAYRLALAGLWPAAGGVAGGRPGRGGSCGGTGRKPGSALRRRLRPRPLHGARRQALRRCTRRCSRLPGSRSRAATASLRTSGASWTGAAPPEAARSRRAAGARRIGKAEVARERLREEIDEAAR